MLISLLGYSQDHYSGNEIDFEDLFGADSMCEQSAYSIWSCLLEKEEIVQIYSNMNNSNAIGSFKLMSFIYSNDSIARNVFLNFVKNSFDSCEKQASFHENSIFPNFLLVQRDSMIVFYFYDYFYEKYYSKNYFDKEKQLLALLTQKSNIILHEISCLGVLYKIEDYELTKYYLGNELEEIEMFHSSFRKVETMNVEKPFVLNLLNKEK